MVFVLSRNGYAHYQAERFFEAEPAEAGFDAAERLGADGFAAGRDFGAEELAEVFDFEAEADLAGAFAFAAVDLAGVLAVEDAAFDFAGAFAFDEAELDPDFAAGFEGDFFAADLDVVEPEFFVEAGLAPAAFTAESAALATAPFAAADSTSLTTCFALSINMSTLPLLFLFPAAIVVVLPLIFYESSLFPHIIAKCSETLCPAIRIAVKEVIETVT